MNKRIGGKQTIYILNENISVVCDGKCDETQLDAAYNLNIENMKKQGATIEAESSVRGQKNIKQVFVLVKQNEKKLEYIKIIQ